jgi:FkbM family methyltransferase
VGTAPGAPVEIRVRGVSVPLACRPASTDAEVLWDTFGGGYHRPPGPLPREATILDLGANVGYTAVDFALRYPRARIVAVELDEGNATVASLNLQPFGERCVVVRAAVWSSDGEVAYGGDEAWGLHVLEDLGDAPTGSAPAIRVGTLIDRLSIDRVDYVKMDIEGGEAEVLADPEWMSRVESIKVEVHPPATLDSCAEMLGSGGFVVERDRRHTECLAGRRPRG